MLLLVVIGTCRRCCSKSLLYKNIWGFVFTCPYLVVVDVLGDFWSTPDLPGVTHNFVTLKTRQETYGCTFLSYSESIHRHRWYPESSLGFRTSKLITVRTYLLVLRMTRMDDRSLWSRFPYSYRLCRYFPLVIHTPSCK